MLKAKPVTASKPKASPRAKPRKVAAPKAKAVAATVPSDAELQAHASRVAESLKAIGKEELAGLKKRAANVFEIFLGAAEDALTGKKK